jgi:hypothetical protein
LSNKRIEHKPIHISHQVVPCENTAKYLGMTLDAKLRWKMHVKKQEELTLKYRKMYWLMGRYSALSVYNKLMLYQQDLNTSVDLWYSTLGLYQPKQQKHYTKISE